VRFPARWREPTTLGTTNVADAFTSLTLALNDAESGFQDVDEVVFPAAVPEPGMTARMALGTRSSTVVVVPEAGLEPARPFGRGILSPLRPFRQASSGFAKHSAFPFCFNNLRLPSFGKLR